MTNEEKAREIARDYSSVELDPKTVIYEACVEIVEWKDEQPISELEGWYAKPPTKDGFYLVDTPDFPKNCKLIVAEWDNRAKCFYSEATDEPIRWNKWKLIEKYNKNRIMKKWLRIFDAFDAFIGTLAIALVYLPALIIFIVLLLPLDFIFALCMLFSRLELEFCTYDLVKIYLYKLLTIYVTIKNI